jgi:hypothetical protein
VVTIQCRFVPDTIGDPGSTLPDTNGLTMHITLASGRSRLGMA